MLSAARGLDSEATGRPQSTIDFLACAALCLTVVGWSLLWATALAIVPFMPLWAGPAIFAVGLLLIPFRRQSGSDGGDGK
jgi:hypothetical protein